MCNASVGLSQAALKRLELLMLGAVSLIRARWQTTFTLKLHRYIDTQGNAYAEASAARDEVCLARISACQPVMVWRLAGWRPLPTHEPVLIIYLILC